MTFTFGNDLTDSLDYIRFETGDVIDGENFLTDEIITSLIATSADNNTAVLRAIGFIIRRLSQPNFRADWLQMDFKSAREGYEQMLKDKQAEYGYGLLTSATVNTYRADGAGTAVPDYSDGRPFDAIG